MVSYMKGFLISTNNTMNKTGLALQTTNSQQCFMANIHPQESLELLQFQIDSKEIPSKHTCQMAGCVGVWNKRLNINKLNGGLRQ